MKHWSLVGLLTAVLVLTSCSSNDTLEPAELEPIQPEIELVELWNARIGGYDEQYLAYAPAIYQDQLYVMNHDGLVVSLSKRDGRTQWRRNLDQPLSGGLGVDDKHVYVAVFDGRLLALNRTDGTTDWEAKLSSEVLAAPQANGDLVIVQTIDGKVFAFDQSGAQRWRYDSVQPVLTLRGTATPYLTYDVTLAGFANGEVVALENRSGSVLWAAKVGVPTGRTELERLVDVDGGFLVNEGLVYTVGYQGKLIALGLSSGQEVWSKPASSIRAPSAGYGNLYWVSDEDDVQANNKSTQAVVWKQENLKRRRLSAPTVFENTLVVGDFEGYVHFLSQVDGHFVARIQADVEGVRSQPVVENGIVYILGDSGRLTAWRIKHKG